MKQLDIYYLNYPLEIKYINEKRKKDVFQLKFGKSKKKSFLPYVVLFVKIYI